MSESGPGPGDRRGGAMAPELDPEGLVRALQEALGPGCEVVADPVAVPPKGWSLFPLPPIHADPATGEHRRRKYSDTVQVFRDGVYVCGVSLGPLRVCIDLRVRFEGDTPRRAEAIAREVMAEFAYEWEPRGWLPYRSTPWGGPLDSFCWDAVFGARLELEKPVPTIEGVAREILDLPERTYWITRSEGDEADGP
jgi:hypothetical protein